MRPYRFVCLICLLVLSPFVFSSGYDDLYPDEKRVVDVFQSLSPKVVYVHRISTVLTSSDELMHVQSGAGSGFIWDIEGHVVTNFHVVQGAKELAVTVGKKTYAAKIIGIEPRKDIAVLQLLSQHVKIALKTLTPFTFVSSQTLLVGQSTIAIGNPFGLDHTLTVGVISALNRQVPGIGGVSIHGMIQTDAPINPGNSGGPLLDSHGRLIGMNTAIYSKSGTSSGIGFAVPSDDIMKIVPQLIQFGRVKLAGIGILQLPRQIAHQFGVDKGVVIAKVLPHTPAFTAGIKGTYRNVAGHIILGDIIVAINDKSIYDYDDLYQVLSNIPIGKRVNLTILRQGMRLHIQLNTVDIASY